MKEFVFDLQRFEDIYLITGTEDADKINNSLTSATINALGGNDSIVNGKEYNTDIGSNVLINGGTGDDYIKNYGSSVTIDAGDGNDYVLDDYDSYNVSINCGDGNDALHSGLSTGNNTIDGGNGSDSISNDGHNTSINGGSGNDSIKNNGHFVTISGGTGNDSIFNKYGSDENDGSNVLIQYTLGDGNDYISGFRADSTLSIDGGSYSSETSGNDVIITVGEGKIILVGAASLSSVNIKGSLSGGSSNQISIPSDALVCNGHSYYVYSNVADTWEEAEAYCEARGGHLAVINDADENSALFNYAMQSGIYEVFFGLSDSKKEGTWTWVNGDSSTYTNWEKNIDIEPNGGISENYASFKSMYTNGTWNDARFSKSAFLCEWELEENFWTLSGTTATFGTSSKTLVTVSGVKSLDGISLSGNVVTVAKSSLGTNNVTISDDGYTLKLGSNVSAPSTSNAWSFSGSTAKYNQTTTAGYTLASDSKSVSYSSGSTKTLVTVSGVKSLDGISLNGKVVTVKKSSLGTSKVTVSGDGYTLKLGSNVSAPSTSNAWSFSGSTAKYNQTTTAGYTLASDSKSVSYSSGSTKTLVTVSGVKSLDGISLSGNVVTVAKSSLGTNNVTISDEGYTLKLGSDVVSPSTSNAWSFSGSTAKYNQTTKAGYTLASDSKSISHSQSSSKTLVSVKGVKSVDGLSIKGKVVTISVASLNKKKITISDGYTLKLSSDVSTPSIKKAAFSLSGTTATYKSSYKTAGYLLASDGKSISYTKATTAESLASIKGASSKTGLSVSGNKITLKKSALKSKVTVSGGYEFDFASDYKKATISGSSSGDTITTRGSNLSINGGKGNDTLKALGTSTTLTGGAGSDVFIYKAGKSGVITDYAAEDKISISGGKVSTIKTSGSNVIFTVGTGKITVKGGKDKTITYSDTGGKNKTYKYKEETIEPADDEIAILPKTYSKENYTMSDNVLEVDASAVRLDISIIGNKFMNKITGGKGNDTLKGGGSNDTLIGGEGADVFIYKKGDVNDLILDYSKEDVVSIKGDTVKDFSASSEDIIFNLASKSKITIAGGKDKLITYVDDKGEHIYPKIFTTKGKTITLTDEYTKNDFDISDYGNYNTINASAVDHGLNIVGNDSANSIFGTADDDTIDGAAGKDTIRGGEGNDSILGGDSNDYIYGGEGSDTLWGGTGNDWLEGGADRDIFVFNSNEGTDTISGYEQGLDKIMILSSEKPILDGTPLSNDVTFNVGKGKIVVDNGANQTIQFVKSNGKNLYTYIPSK